MYYGLIGENLVHSFSKKYFSNFFLNNFPTNIYENIECKDISEVKSCLESKKYHGINITIPYKEKIIKLLTSISDEAEQIGAVNVVKLIDNKYFGYNTDCYGFHQSIKPFLKNSHEKALILGTGGASKAVDYVLKNIGIDVFYVSRNCILNKCVKYSDLNENMFKTFKLIINCTPLGTFPNVYEKPNIPYKYINESHLLVDLIYNPDKSSFLLEGEKRGAEILNGKNMLIEQAKKSWEIWSK